MVKPGTAKVQLQLTDSEGNPIPDEASFKDTPIYKDLQMAEVISRRFGRMDEDIEDIYHSFLFYRILFIALCLIFFGFSMADIFHHRYIKKRLDTQLEKIEALERIPEFFPAEDYIPQTSTPQYPLHLHAIPGDVL